MRNLAIVTILLALVACGGGKSSQNATSAPASGAASVGIKGANPSAAPNCGAVQAVWVNLNTKVYHEPGDQYYGKTKHGEYLCPAQAHAQGFHKAGAGAGTSHS
jgi:hypothetical protein